jgi:hypothetical protein
MKNRAAEIRAGLKHPAIDGDGHWLEPVPVFLDYLREAGGAPSVDGMRALWQRAHLWYRSTGPSAGTIAPGAAIGGASPARLSTRPPRCCRLC